MKLSINLRLLNKTKVNPETQCWEWLGMKDKDGYGKMCVNGKAQRTHRLSYQFFHGTIETGLGVLHTCDNPSCNNPAHLYTGTHKQNQKDKKDRGRVVGNKHPYSKLTEQDVLFIRASKESQSKLAKQFGVIQAHISRIKRRVNWTHI